MTTKLRDEQAGKRSFLRNPTFWLAVIAITSLVVGLLGALLAYLALKEPVPAVTFETISDTNVLDLHRPMRDLEVVFRGQNIQEQNLNLRIMTINVINSGDVDILSSHYDPGDNWGIKFKDGQVIEERLVDASSEYLRSNVVPQRLSVDTIAFPKVIFEKDAFFAIEVLILHPKSESPAISSVGKIAGINRISILTRPLAREDVGFVTELFQGSALIQVVRTIVYLLGTFLTAVTVILALVGITVYFDNLRAKRRRPRILQTRTISQIDQAKIRNFLVDQYESSGITRLKELQELIKDPSKIEWVKPPARWVVSDYHEDGDLSAEGITPHIEHKQAGLFYTLDALVTMSILKRGESDNAIIDPTFGETVDSLLAELES